MNNFEYYFNYISINVKSHLIKMTIQLNKFIYSIPHEYYFLLNG